MKKVLSDYTKIEFIELINTLIQSDDNEISILIDLFESLTQHPAGSDLIFYPEPGQDDSPEGITETIEIWRNENGLSTFKKDV